MNENQYSFDILTNNGISKVVNSREEDVKHNKDKYTNNHVKETQISWFVCSFEIGDQFDHLKPKIERKIIWIIAGLKRSLSIWSFWE